MALAQARLPVKLGGMGLTSMEAIRGAAWIGTWPGALLASTARHARYQYGQVAHWLRSG